MGGGFPCKLFADVLSVQTVDLLGVDLPRIAIGRPLLEERVVELLAHGEQLMLGHAFAELRRRGSRGVHRTKQLPLLIGFDNARLGVSDTACPAQLHELEAASIQLVVLVEVALHVAEGAVSVVARRRVVGDGAGRAGVARVRPQPNAKLIGTHVVPRRAAVVPVGGPRLSRDCVTFGSWIIARHLAVGAVRGPPARAACADRDVGGQRLDEQFAVRGLGRGIADVTDPIEVLVVLVPGRLILALLAVRDERAVVLAIEVAVGVLIGVSTAIDRVIVRVAGSVEAIAVSVTAVEES